MKYHVFILLILIFTGITKTSRSQCNNRLVEIAASESGNDALYIKEFKIKYKKGKRNKPARVAKFQTLLKEGTLYRFNVTNADEFDGQAVMQLFNSDKMLGTTYNWIERTDNRRFDYYCPRTGLYEVCMSFREGKEGCAVGILSMVVTDSTNIEQSGKKNPDDMQVLYIGYDNPINIAASGVPGGSLEVSISQGTITGSKGNYSVRVEQEGIATVKVIARDRNGKINEVGTTNFRVIQLSMPRITMAGIKGGIIEKSMILNQNSLQLELPDFSVNDYEIVEFTISNEYNGYNGKTSYSHRITNEQKRFIENIEKGTNFFITDIKIRTPNGEIRTVDPVGFIVQ